MTQREAEERLRSFLDLKEGWNSYGGAPIDRLAVLEANRLLDLLGNGWTPVPCSNGGVQLERHDGGLDVEISIARSGEAAGERKSSN